MRTWLHCAHLQMGGAKMAKSIGNIARVADLVAAGTSTRALRYALISVHYRMGVNYSPASLAAAGAAVDRLDAVLAALRGYREERADDPTLDAALEQARTGFEAALDDDLSISPALAAVFELVRDLNRRIDARCLSTADAGRALAVLASFDTVLGLGPDVVDDLDARAACPPGRPGGGARRS